MRTTKQQRNKLFDCHVGVGFLALKVAPDSIMEVEVFTNKGVLCRVADGKPVFPVELCDDDDNKVMVKG